MCIEEEQLPLIWLHLIVTCSIISIGEDIQGSATPHKEPFIHGFAEGGCAVQHERRSTVPCFSISLSVGISAQQGL